MSEQEDEVVETFHHWFQQNYPLYERDGRDTTIKRKMEQAWNSAQKASTDTIAAAEAKCVELEKALQTIAHGMTTDFPGAPDVMTAVSPAEFRSAMWTWSQRVARAALPQPSDTQRDG